MRAPGKRTLHRRLAAGIIVVILVAAAAWYTRPVDLYALSPDLGEPQDLTCLLLRYTDNLAEDTTRTLDLTAEDGEVYRQVLSQLESLRFRRFPLGGLLQSLRDGHSRVITPGILTPATSWATAPAMCCCNAAWMVGGRHVRLARSSLPAVSLCGGTDATASLHESIWELAQPVESNP